MSRALYKCSVFRFDRSPNPSGIHPLSPELYDKFRCCRQYRLQRLSGISPFTRKRGRRGGREGGRESPPISFQSSKIVVEDQRGPHVMHTIQPYILESVFSAAKVPKDKKTAPKVHRFLGPCLSQLLMYFSTRYSMPVPATILVHI